MHFFSGAEDWITFRREVQRRLGKCVKYKYKLHGTTGDACPECGTIIQSSPTSRKMPCPAPLSLRERAGVKQITP